MAYCNAIQESPGGAIVGVHSALANKMALQLLQQHLLPELEPYTTIQPEVGWAQQTKTGSLEQGRRKLALMFYYLHFVGL